MFVFQFGKSHFPYAHGLMIFIELMRANGVNELENFCIFQSEKSHFTHAKLRGRVGRARCEKSQFPYAHGLMTFIELMRANGVSELENFGIFSSKRAISSMLAG